MSKQNSKRYRVLSDQPIVGIGAVIIKEGKILLEKRKNSLEEENGAFQVVW